MTRVRLSVAIATCGRPEDLRHCLKAIAKQTRLPDELIVVDQNPLAETADVIRGSGLSVSYYEQPRLGLSASRNLAMEKARGDVLAVTDDDCAPDPDWAEALVSAFSRDEAPDAVTGPILPPRGEPPPGMYALSLRTSTDTRDFSGRTIPWAIGSGANFTASLPLLRKLGGWDERLGTGTRGMAAEDCEIIDRLLSSGGTIRYDARAVMRHAWQSRARRKATRWSYGFGIGALCGLRLGQHDGFALRMLKSYSKMQLRSLLREAARLNWAPAGERLTALAALIPGCLYGFQAARQSARAGTVEEGSGPSK